MMTLTWQLCCWASLVAWVALLQQTITMTQLVHLPATASTRSSLAVMVMQLVMMTMSTATMMTGIVGQEG
jgi:hypothetical protein